MKIHWCPIYKVGRRPTGLPMPAADRLHAIFEGSPHQGAPCCAKPA